MTNASRLTQVLAPLRTIAGTIRHFPDRLLHSARRARAIERLTNIGQMDAVAFICYGNVCRSPFAEALFASLTRGRPDQRAPIAVCSAGFIGPGRQPPDAALAAASRRGLDLRQHRSTLITKALVETGALLVVMSHQQARDLVVRFGARPASVLVLGDLDPQPIKRRTIHDPWGGDAATFDASYDRIERCVEELALALFGRGDRKPPND